MAKYLATSFARLNVVNAPRVMMSCLPISTMSMSLVGLLSRSTMLPASRAACVPVFIATPTSAWASAGASFVPSPVMATRCPAACSSRMRLSFCSGVACAMKSSTPGFGGNGGGGERIVARDHHGSDAHFAQMREAFLDAAFHHVFQLNDAEHFAAFRHDQGVPPEREISSTPWLMALREHAAQLIHIDANRVRRAFADGRGPAGRRTAGKVHAAHARLRGERDELRVRLRRLRGRAG